MANMKQVYAIARNSELRWKEIYPELDHYSGIYVLTRQDENGFKYSYIGQAKDVLKRLGQHLTGYQHIDLSLKKHGLKGEYGWKIKEIIKCTEDQLDEAEQAYIKKYANLGYQLRNKTSGSQGEGKDGLDVERKPSKGYYDGVEYGYNKAIKEIGILFDKYLDAVIKGDSNKIKERKLEEFLHLIRGDKDETTTA